MYLKGWWSVAVWFLLPAWLIKTFNLYVNATWGSYHLHTCTWRKIINSSLMWQLWEFMGMVGEGGGGVGRGGGGGQRSGWAWWAAPTRTSPLQEWPDAQASPRRAGLTVTHVSPHDGMESVPYQEVWSMNDAYVLLKWCWCIQLQSY